MPTSRRNGAERGSPWAWKLRVLALVVAFAAVAWARSRQVDIPFKDPHGKLFRAKIVDTAEILLLFILVDIVVRWLRGRRGRRDAVVDGAHPLDAVPDRDDRGGPAWPTSSSTSATAT